MIYTWFFLWIKGVLNRYQLIPSIINLIKLRGSMNFRDSSFLHSSSNSYRNLDGQSTPRNRDFVKYLYNQQPASNTPYREEKYPHSSPLIKRHHSQESIAPKPIAPRHLEQSNTFHNRFCESIVKASNLGNYMFGNYQKEMADLSAREIMLNTEKELLQKEIRRLKDEIEYLNEKNETLQKNN